MSWISSAGEVIFDCTHPGYPPDIIFSEGDEQMEFEPDIDQLEVCALIVCS